MRLRSGTKGESIQSALKGLHTTLHYLCDVDSPCFQFHPNQSKSFALDCAAFICKRFIYLYNGYVFSVKLAQHVFLISTKRWLVVTSLVLVCALKFLFVLLSFPNYTTFLHATMQFVCNTMQVVMSICHM